MQYRLQKILSEKGICSRRKAEEYIEQGLVTVNGVTAQIGQKADPEVDTIDVDGKVLDERKEMLYYIMNKPIGVVTTNLDPNEKHPEPTVRSILPKELQGKVYPVGRLDKATSGLLLLTNDGVLAYRLTHPKFYHEKEYTVESSKIITEGQFQKLTSGLTILGEKLKPVTVKKLSNKSFSIALTEGKNRQIRRMCKKVGIPLVSLVRTRIVNINDHTIASGAVRLLAPREISTLKESMHIDK